MKVHTIKGLIDSEDLRIVDEILLEDNARVFTTTWYLEDELVRRDVNVNILRGLSFDGETTSI